MKWSWRLANLATALALVVVFLGAWTRLNDAGLGCPDWPVCYGHLVLPAAADAHLTIAAKFPGQAVDLHKGWLEMIHRYAASTLGLIILVQALWGWHQRRIQGYPWRHSVALVMLVALQGAFGMWTVTLKLVPWVVTLHLLGGLTILALLVRLRQRLRRTVSGWPSEGATDVRVRLLLVALFLQLTLGGWTSSNYAGWACDHWLNCRAGQEVSYDFGVGLNPLLPTGPNYEGGMLPGDARAAIQVAHRVGALLLVAVLAVVSWQHWHGSSSTRVWLRRCWLLVSLQIVLGMLNVIWQLPLPLAIAHHAGAVVLLLAVMGLYESARVQRTEVFHGYLSPG